MKGKFLKSVLFLVAMLLCCTMVSCSDDDDEPKAQSGMINGHEYVDMGLSVKWATCNVGASSPSDYGNYYAWGEIETKDDYSRGNSVTWEKNFDDIAGDPNYDAARANWGSTWRLPTSNEVRELTNNCSWEWTTLNGVNGVMATSNKNGNSIFLPATGCYYGSSLSNVGIYGYYWSSTPLSGYTQDAYGFSVDSDDFMWRFDLTRYFGSSVRPVSD